MKITKFKDEDQWLSARRGKITGTKLGKLISKRNGNKLIGFYELIAERLAIPPDDENCMDRGNRLEEEAVKRFEKETKKKVNMDKVLWTRDDNPGIGISPDGSIGKTEALEIKCLGSARHIEALLTGEIPKDYHEQVLQYFIVNDDLKKLYFIFYDPRIIAKDYFSFEVDRKSVQAEVSEYLNTELDILKEIDEIVSKLSGF